MQNYRQNGERLKFFPAESLKPGDLFVEGDLAAVALGNYDVDTDSADGVIGALKGVHDLPKGAGAWMQGQKLYQDATNPRTVVATDNSGANVFIGHAADVATADATTGSVRLKG